MIRLSFPNGVIYYGPSDGKGNTEKFKIDIDGLIYSGAFHKGLFSGSITRPAYDDMYGTVEMYNEGQLVERCGIDEDGLLV